ncbi:uncharacterized protein B0H18DRAFT_1170813 [Fomitopsis serialis]|uniref:uncharacterized protein n=1 Tax=Fomitopsis serialis TaxID=139415 RepID=UPI0020082314|nr:uncharacterized protein B0H18DRAFT_1170813 [Neoantrodia serialis]KAH9925267.1 hypothetical protein B0H18DRAFT_1170813 [Neoantrodia serialis]
MAGLWSSNAHRWVYETFKILHRDISVDNIMWFVRDGRIGPATSPWRLKTWVNTEQKPTTAPSQLTPMQIPRYRTGLFMAMDLLRSGRPPVHKYRHDLESFFYVYAYATAAYNPVTKTFGHIAQWQRGSLVDVGKCKHEFFTRRKELLDVFSEMHPLFEPLLQPGTFFVRLLTLFAILERHRDKVDEVTWGYLEDTLDAGVAAQVEEIERERDQMVTYSTFMEILGEPEDV